MPTVVLGFQFLMIERVKSLLFFKLSTILVPLFGDGLFSIIILGADNLFTTLSAALLPRASAPDTANFSTPVVAAFLATSLENFEVAIDVIFLPVDLKITNKPSPSIGFFGAACFILLYFFVLFILCLIILLQLLN